MQELLNQAEDLLAEYVALRSASIMVGALIASWLAEVVICRSLAAAASKTTTDFDDKLIAALRRPIFLSVLFYGLSWALDPLDLPEKAIWAAWRRFLSDGMAIPVR